MIFFRPTKFEHYLHFISLQKYEMVKMPGCEVAWADYPALQRDFTFLAEFSANEIDAWILENFSYMAKNQLQLGELRNTKIPTTAEETIAYRQANYGSQHQEFQGRGDFMEVRHPKTKELVGFIDRKGVGVSHKKIGESAEIFEAMKKSGGDAALKIQTKNLSSGLAYLGEAMIEAALMKATQRTFDLINFSADYDSPFPKVEPFDKNFLQTIEGYFVLRLPFNVHAGPYESQPAGIYARQAHIGRVWTGKIFTNKVNIKQADFFLALCDAGTVRIRIPELAESSMMIEGGPRLKQYEVGMDIVKRYLAGEKNALENTLQKVFAPAKEKLNAIDAKIIANPGFQDPLEAFSKLLELIDSDPERFCRFSEVLWFAMKYSPSLISSNQNMVNRIVNHYLALSPKIKDIDDSGKPLRRWGLLLIACLSQPQREEKFRQEASRWFVEPEFLGRCASLLPFKEIEPILPYLFRYAGAWIQDEVESVFKDPDFKDSSRKKEVEKIMTWMKGKKPPYRSIPFSTPRDAMLHQLFVMAHRIGIKINFN